MIERKRSETTLSQRLGVSAGRLFLHACQGTRKHRCRNRHVGLGRKEMADERCFIDVKLECPRLDHGALSPLDNTAGAHAPTRKANSARALIEIDSWYAHYSCHGYTIVRPQSAAGARCP